MPRDTLYPDMPNIILFVVHNNSCVTSHTHSHSNSTRQVSIYMHANMPPKLLLLRAKTACMQWLGMLTVLLQCIACMQMAWYINANLHLVKSILSKLSVLPSLLLLSAGSGIEGRW